MNDETTKSARLVLRFTGEIQVEESDIKLLLQRVIPSTQPPLNVTPSPVYAPAKADLLSKRLMFSAKETAELLGVTQKTVYRLVQRQLLKSSKALRLIKIPKSEIERFLKTTTA